MRVLVILAMIWQPLVLAVATHRSAPVPFSDTSCSAMVAETSCCDSTPVASLCPPPIDPCLCGAQPDDPEPRDRYSGDHIGRAPSRCPAHRRVLPPYQQHTQPSAGLPGHLANVDKRFKRERALAQFFI